MSEGKVGEPGPPQEVYFNPADTFVGGFLGSPPMNFFTQDNVIAGFRPEQFLPKEVYQGGQEPMLTLWFQVNGVENPGAGRPLNGTLKDMFQNGRVVANRPSTRHPHVPPGA